jgi:hypothetical protein
MQTVRFLSYVTLSLVATAMIIVPPLLFGRASLALAPWLAVVVSMIYFWSSPSSAGVTRRLLVSAHGVVIAVLYFFFLTNSANVIFRPQFLLLSLVPALFVVVCRALYRGNPAVHLLQLANLACLSWTLVVALKAITNNILW